VFSRNALEVGPERSIMALPRTADSFDLTQQYTFVLWIKPYQGEGRIIDRNTAGTIDGFSFDLLTFNQTKRSYLRLCAAHQCFLSRKHITLNRWHHVAVGFDSSKHEGVKFYIDGKHDSTHGSFKVPTSFLSTQLTIGSAAVPYGTHRFSGQLDEISLWTRSLSFPEIRALQFQQLFGDEVGLMAYFTFNHQAHNVTEDFSINKLHGEIRGNISFIESKGKPLYMN